jgi:uncharacterized protein with GYD domain
MGLYLTRAKYTGDAFKGMIGKPHDRGEVAKTLFKAAGMKLHSVYFSPSTAEIVCLVAGDAAQASAVDMVIIASGAFSAVSSIELVDMEEMQQAMKAASKIARKYKAPHQ